ncbi:hypothetical protein RBWH47_04184 [Rhodopirellula baltica WH47]|uniref:Uncharacterized protein n=1 Tax=Rhodopirellula baltica WH47 TaxID=991778 RepID=F2ARZ9_RHOBT|nr:hypothetical protein RBWH47_04184 [Rhodopirellula baltica WH47]
MCRLFALKSGVPREAALILRIRSGGSRFERVFQPGFRQLAHASA